MDPIPLEKELNEFVQKILAQGCDKDTIFVDYVVSDRRIYAFMEYHEEG